MDANAGIPNSYLYLGIDPGPVSGALALIDGEGSYLSVSKMPGNESMQIHKTLMPIMFSYGVYIVIEQQLVFPQQGVSSTAKTHRNFGLLEGMVMGMGIKPHVVHPKVWQKEFLDPGGEKAERKLKLKKIAAHKWPKHKIVAWNTDALLLAEWLRLQHKQGRF